MKDQHHVGDITRFKLAEARSLFNVVESGSEEPSRHRSEASRLGEHFGGNQKTCRAATPVVLVSVGSSHSAGPLHRRDGNGAMEEGLEDQTSLSLTLHQRGGGDGGAAFWSD